MKASARTGPYTTYGFQFWVQDCTIWYDADGNGTVETNETWEEFNKHGNIDERVKNSVKLVLQELGCSPQ